MHSSILLLTTTIATTLPQIAEHVPAFDQFHAVDRWTLGAGQVHVGDAYAAAGVIRIDGELRGDLVGVAEDIFVNGPIEGDLLAAAKVVRIEGPVGDSARIAGESIHISDRIDGDLLVMAGRVVLDPGSHVTGNVLLFAGKASLEGTIDGDLVFKGGEIVLRGSVGHEVRLVADTIKLASGTHLGGDLSYESRRELERAEDVTIAGEIHYQPQLDEDEDEEDGSGWFRWLVRVWFFLGALLVGLVVTTVARRSAPLMLAQLGREPMLAALVGFGTSLIVPAAAFIAIALIAPALLGLFTLVVFCLVIYLAKLPVAMWIGTRAAKLLRFNAPPALAVAMGLSLLYPLFWLPCLGKLVWLVTAWIGLGSLILVARVKLPTHTAP